MNDRKDSTNAGEDPQVKLNPQQPKAEMLKKAEQLAKSVQFAQNAQRATDSFEDMGLLLTNDIRTLAPFDRAFLITFIAGETKLFSATAQTEPGAKAKLTQTLVMACEALKGLERILIISPRGGRIKTPVQGLADDTVGRINDYCEISSCQHIVFVPLRRGDATIGLIVMEFMEDSPPDSDKIMALGTVGPFLAGSLAERWLAESCPKQAEKLNAQQAHQPGKTRFYRFTLPLVAGLVALFLFLMLVPRLDFTVGGETELVPTHRSVAFVRRDGIIDTVHVKEGDAVEEGQVIATLDPKELDFEIKKAKRELEILTREMELLRNSAGDDRSKFAESQIVQLRRENKFRELEFLKSRRKYLEILSPVTGEIVTKDVESLTGKSLQAGEPFCEIAEKGRISAQVRVPEERIGYVAEGMPLFLYLNTDPTNAIELSVEKIAPRSEVKPRLGNVFAVRSRILNPSPDLRVGMKGTGKIVVGEKTAWFIISRRLLTRWNQLKLHF
jgi:multidrug efflux pump subunit AcrA (membrane-fusion protein)